MPNTLSGTGITIVNLNEEITALTGSFQSIYGANINVFSDTPDGNLINDISEITVDTAEFIQAVYTYFDPDQAIGVVLDQRTAINGVKRKGGTYTTTYVNLTITGSTPLYGQDQTVQPVYTVADSAGNQWQLLTTNLSATTGNYLFVASASGAVQTIQNTITIPVTVLLAVTAINNPNTYVTLGLNQEADSTLKLRRQISVSMPSQGYLNSLLAALLNTAGVADAEVYENNTSIAFTGSPSPGNLNGLLNGLPGHSIWVVVGGTASNATIANIIYNYRNAGCGMYNSLDSGAQSYTITQADGSPFIIYWDDVVNENLFIKFNVVSINGITPPLISTIVNGLSGIFETEIGTGVNVNSLVADIIALDPNSYVSGQGFSTAYNGSYTSTLLPASGSNKFLVSANNIIVTPVIMSSPTSTVAVSGGNIIVTDVATHSGGTLQFSVQGGYGPYSYSFMTNLSGGTIGASTGLYTPGSSGSVTDVVEVTDALSNTATVSISVL